MENKEAGPTSSPTSASASPSAGSSAPYLDAIRDAPSAELLLGALVALAAAIEEREVTITKAEVLAAAKAKRAAMAAAGTVSGVEASGGWSKEAAKGLQVRRDGRDVLLWYRGSACRVLYVLCVFALDRLWWCILTPCVRWYLPLPLLLHLLPRRFFPVASSPNPLQRALKAFAGTGAGTGRVVFLETIVVGQLVVVLKQPVQVLKISRVLSVDGGGGAEGKGVHAERPIMQSVLSATSPFRRERIVLSSSRRRRLVGPRAEPASSGLLRALWSRPLFALSLRPLRLLCPCLL